MDIVSVGQCELVRPDVDYPLLRQVVDAQFDEVEQTEFAQVIEEFLDLEVEFFEVVQRVLGKVRHALVLDHGVVVGRAGGESGAAFVVVVACSIVKLVDLNAYIHGQLLWANVPVLDLRIRVAEVFQVARRFGIVEFIAGVAEWCQG